VVRLSGASLIGSTINTLEQRLFHTCDEIPKVNFSHQPQARAVPIQMSSTKRCSTCLIEYPLEQFRRRYRDIEIRANRCRVCHNQSERLRRQRRRGWLTKREFNKHLTSLKNQRTARGVERVYLDLVQQCGGTDGLVKMWTGAMGKDVAEGGFRAYRHIASIIRLMQHYENAQPDKPDYSTMSDEELLDRLARVEAFGH
jgi:hypothetical protein